MTTTTWTTASTPSSASSTSANDEFNTLIHDDAPILPTLLANGPQPSWLRTQAALVATMVWRVVDHGSVVITTSNAASAHRMARQFSADRKVQRLVFGEWVDVETAGDLIAKHNAS